MSYNDDYRLKECCGFVLALLIFFFVGRGLFSFATQIYEERKLSEEPITGTIVSYEMYRNYESTIKDIVVEFDYKGNTYTLDSREQTVFSSGRLQDGFSDDYSTITVYVNPEEPQKSRVLRRLAGWDTLLIVSIAGFMWLGALLFMVIKLIQSRRTAHY